MTPKPGLAFITIMATLAYLGLAVLGWGGLAVFLPSGVDCACNHTFRAGRRRGIQ